jgi:hypothetical protein
MKVRELTETQKNDLINVVYNDGMLFNPVQDNQDRWIISNEEVDHCTNESVMWVKNLPEIDFDPKIEIIV